MFSCSCFFFFFSRRRRHTRCALVTGVQTCALPISYRRHFGFHPPYRQPRLRLGPVDERYVVHTALFRAWASPGTRCPRQCSSDDAPAHIAAPADRCRRSEEHTSELQSPMRISSAAFWSKQKPHSRQNNTQPNKQIH